MIKWFLKYMLNKMIFSIENKNLYSLLYTEAIDKYTGDMLIVGITYDDDKKTLL